MASKKRSGGLKPDVQLDSHFSHPERERIAFDGSEGYVMGSSDGEYGHVTGFRHTITSTGHRHKTSPVQERMRGR